MQALAKGDRSELAVEMMTEMGVSEIVPWQASRSIVRWSEERGVRSLTRWRSTVREAAKQSRRLNVPQVSEPVTTRQLAQRVASADLTLMLHEEADESIAEVDLPEAGTVLIIIGPEGGIAADELGELTRAGARPVSISDGVLRTSTAGVVALAGLKLRRERAQLRPDLPALASLSRRMALSLSKGASSGFDELSPHQPSDAPFGFHPGRRRCPGRLGRTGVITTPHGTIRTPAFVAVGTKATVKAVLPESVAALGAQAVLANAYHLYLQPGADVIDAAGGLGRFMNWPGPTFTDSGGFQVMSLGVGFKKVLAMNTDGLEDDDVIAARQDPARPGRRRWRDLHLASGRVAASLHA